MVVVAAVEIDQKKEVMMVMVVAVVMALVEMKPLKRKELKLELKLKMPIMLLLMLEGVENIDRDGQDIMLALDAELEGQHFQFFWDSISF